MTRCICFGAAAVALAICASAGAATIYDDNFDLVMRVILRVHRFEAAIYIAGFVANGQDDANQRWVHVA